MGHKLRPSCKGGDIVVFCLVLGKAPTLLDHKDNSVSNSQRRQYLDGD